MDKNAERLIIRNIRCAFPDHAILSEESEPKNKESPFKWIIDPIDGTTNFIHSFPFFCVSIALEEAGEVMLGVVYDPLREELFLAERGSGAYLNRKRIQVSKVKRLAEGFLATGFSYGIKGARHTNIENFANFLMKALAIRRAGSAALDLCYVACGRFDGFWELDLFPWDTAAAALIVKEAGGVVTKFDGKPYRHYDHEILASNSFINQDMIKILAKEHA